MYVLQACWASPQKVVSGWCTAHHDSRTAPVPAITPVGHAMLGPCLPQKQMPREVHRQEAAQLSLLTLACSHCRHLL